MSTPITDQAKKTDMLRKVRALLAKAEAAGVTEPEAETLTAKAAELMARYGIDKAVAEARAHVKAVPSNKIFTIDEPYSQVKSHLVSAIAGALHCQCVLLTTRGPKSRIHVFGFESDIEQVEMLYTSLLLQMSTATARHEIKPWLQGRQVMAERRSFMLGFVGGVKPRLVAAYAVAVAETDDSGTPGTELVLASRDLDVKNAKDTEYPHTRSTKITYSGRGYSKGHAAGQNANIHNRGTVGSGGRALTR